MEMNQNRLEKRTNWQKIINYFSRLTANYYISILLILLLAALLIVISNLIPQFNDVKRTDENVFHLIFRDVGLALFPLTIISLVYEILLRRSFLETMSNTIKEVMPKEYNKMREAGLIDIFPELKLDKLKDDFEALEKSEIRIMGIWIENFNKIQYAIIKAIKEKDCKVKILLWNPQYTDALENRARSLRDGSSTRSLVENILKTLMRIEHIFQELENHPQKGNFEVKLHNSFVAVSFISFGDECLIGHYLRGRLESMGTQIKVSGKTHYFYQELDRHFTSQWNDENHDCNLDFYKGDFQKFQDWYDTTFIAKQAKH